MKPSHVHIFCDFDGTITTRDSVDFLLEALADPSWRDVESRWERGEIGSRECMAEQVALMRGGWAAVEKALADIEVDPTFAAFTLWCRRNGFRLTIVSDGIDRVIRHLLAREGIIVDHVVANSLEELDDGTLQLTFPASSAGCRSGVCKCKVLRRASSTMQVVIGDGRSDFCCAQEADVVFAKSKLLAHCEEHDLRHIAFDDFADVQMAFEEIAEEVRPRVLAKVG